MKTPGTVLPVDIEPEPAKCPKCGSRKLGAVRPEDVEVGPGDPEDAPPTYPGTMECMDCGELIAWEP